MQALGRTERLAILAILAIAAAFVGGCTCSETHTVYVYRDAATDGATDGAAHADGGDGGEGSDTCDWSPWNGGLAGGQVSTLAFDPRVRDRVYATTGTRVYMSDDAGDTWTLRSEGTSIRRLTFPSSDSDALLGASSLGIVASNDAGATWTVLSLGGLNVRTVAVAPSNPQRVYAAVDLTGVVKSLDGGVTWQSVVNGLPYGRVEELAVHPGNADRVVAVAQEAVPTCDAGSCSFLVYTDTAGATWDVPAGPLKRSASAIAYCDEDPNIVYAAVGDDVVKSTDGGAVWSPAGLPINLSVQGLAVGGNNCMKVYAASFSAGVYRSDDGAATWSGPFTDTVEDYTSSLSLDGLAMDPRRTNRVFVAARSGAFMSANSGEAWSIVPALGNVAVRDLSRRAPASGDEELWLATWGTGLWHRAVTDASWTHVPVATFEIDFVQTARTSPLNANVLVAANLHSEDGGASFSPTGVSGAMDVDFDPNRANTVAIATQTGGLKLRTTANGTYDDANGNLTPWQTANGVYIDLRAVRFVPGTEGAIVVGTNGKGIHLSNDDGVHWNPVGNFENLLVDCL
ncbi:MAG: hypothetical protein KC417_16890, partial [Myxococcales bacterium]|nr:hypothetical protein [Myxococcales bacterium]